jgi:hypothetical protein
MAVLKWRAGEAPSAAAGRSDGSGAQGAEGGERVEKEEPATLWELDCDVKVDAMLQVPSPLSIVPRPVCSQTSCFGFAQLRVCGSGSVEDQGVEEALRGQE